MRNSFNFHIIFYFYFLFKVAHQNKMKKALELIFQMVTTLRTLKNELIQQCYEIYLTFRKNFTVNYIYAFIKDLGSVLFNICMQSFIVSSEFVKNHSFFFVSLICIFLICLVIYVHIRYFLMYIRFFKLVDLIKNLNENSTYPSDLPKDLVYFSTEDFQNNVLRDDFGIERECLCIKRYIEKSTSVSYNEYGSSFNWLSHDLYYVKEDIKANNFILSRDLTYYGKVTKTEPTSEDLQRFEQTKYFQFENYKYVGNGYFYIDSKKPRRVGNMRSSSYIWKPNKISVLGKKENNKIVPIKYHGFTLGAIGEGIVEPKYLIQFPHFLYIIILFIVSFYIMLAGMLLTNFNFSYQILTCAYFLVVILSLFNLYLNSYGFQLPLPRINYL